MGLLEAQGKEKTFFKSSSKKFQLIGKENKAAGKAMNWVKQKKPGVNPMNG